MSTLVLSEARPWVQLALETPLPNSPDDDELASYLCILRRGLEGLLPLATEDSDLMEAKELLVALARVQERVGPFHISSDDNDMTMWSIVQQFRQARDPHVACVARVVFARMCDAASKPDERQDTKSWREEAWETVFPPQPPCTMANKKRKMCE